MAATPRQTWQTRSAGSWYEPRRTAALRSWPDRCPEPTACWPSTAWRTASQVPVPRRATLPEHQCGQDKLPGNDFRPGRTLNKCVCRSLQETHGVRQAQFGVTVADRRIAITAGRERLPTELAGQWHESGERRQAHDRETTRRADDYQVSKERSPLPPPLTDHIKGRSPVPPPLTDHAKGRSPVPPPLTDHIKGRSPVAPPLTDHTEGRSPVAPPLTDHIKGRSPVAPPLTDHTEGRSPVAPPLTDHIKGRSPVAPPLTDHTEGRSPVAPPLTDHIKGRSPVAPPLTDHTEGRRSG